MKSSEASTEAESPPELASSFVVFSQLTTDRGIIAAMNVISQIVGTKVLTVKNDEMEVEYSGLLIQAKQITKKVEERRKAIVEPLNRSVRAVNDWIKRQITGPIVAKEAEINNALLKYRIKKADEAAERQRKADALQAKLQADAEKKGIDLEVPALVMPTPEKIVRVGTPGGGGGQVQERKQFFLEVTDLKALVDAVSAGTVPLDALVANTTVLNNLAKGGMQIPGVSHGYKTGLTVRGSL